MRTEQIRFEKAVLDLYLDGEVVATLTLAPENPALGSGVTLARAGDCDRPLGWDELTHPSMVYLLLAARPPAFHLTGPSGQLELKGKWLEEARGGDAGAVAGGARDGP